ncbi:MAG: tetratricopeptide repeat protein [Kiritimatiellae bacterium]|nr:tetratricopeptide repeat protein [Kiritimatiellia bacterium]
MKGRETDAEPEGGAAGPADPGPALRRLLLLFGVAFAVRLLYLLEIRSAPFFDVLIVDARGYDDWARRIAAGEWLGGDVFYQAPLYPYFLGVVYAVFGRSLFLVRALQSLLGAASCVLIALAGERFFSRRAGLTAGWLLAFYAPAVFFDGVVQKAALGLFLTSAVLFLAARAVERPGKLALFLPGLALGLLALTRENALAFVPLVALWPWFRLRERPARFRLRLIVFFAAGLALVLLPVAWRNVRVGGEFHITTSQFGPNFYIGNNEQADGMYVPLREGRGSPEFERADATELAEAALGRTLTPREVSRYWTGKALAFMRSQPGRWLTLMGRKLLLTWNAAEVADAENLETYRRWSWLLAALSRVFHFGVLAPLAAAGLVLTLGQWRRLWLLYGLLLVTTAGVALFFVFARYRFPLVPVLVLFAGAGLPALWHAARRRHSRAVALPIGMACVVAVVANLPLLAQHGKTSSALMWYDIGSTLGRDGRHAEAVPFFRKALEIDPNHENARFDLGNVLSKCGDLPGAVEQYRLVLSLNPKHAEAHYNLGNLLAEAGDLPGAVRHYEAALAAKPGYARAHYNLGNVRVKQQKYDEAAAQYRAAVRIDPDFTAAYNNLGNVCMLRKQYRHAALHYERVLELDPANEDARRNLAAAREAIAAGERAR